MSFSEIPPPPEIEPGQDEPVLRVKPPGPQSRTWLTRMSRTAAPMGPRKRRSSAAVRADVPAGTIVYHTAKGSNVIDVDGNRYVDFAAGFGALLAGHAHPNLLRVLELQSQRLFQALGDLYPSEPKIALLERLAKLHPAPGARVILGQSGADAVSAALKTALLRTGRPGVIAFEGAYHGLSYGPLAACGLRASYREPFSLQLNPHVRFFEFPRTADRADLVLERIRLELSGDAVGAILIEPILGRGGCVVPPPDFLAELGGMAKVRGALIIADEIWTGLGRTGSWIHSVDAGLEPDLICLGKGLGGGLPISACIGSDDVMQSWERDAEVIHTSTFAGAPLACTTAIAMLDLLSRESLLARSAEVGSRFLTRLRDAISGCRGVAELRGAGLMLAIDLGERPGAAIEVQQRLLERGYIVSTGGGQRETIMLTPPLNLSERLLNGFVDALRATLDSPAT